MRNLILFGMLFLHSAVFSQATFSKQYGDSINDHIMSSAISCKSGGYLLSGNTRQWFMGGSVEVLENAAYLVRIDENGDTLWTRHHNMDSIGVVLNTYELANGNFFVLSETYLYFCNGLIVAPPGYYKQFQVSHLDNNGNILSTTTIANSCDHALYGITQLNDGNFLIYLATSYFPNSTKYIIKVDVNGNTLWTNYPLSLQSTSYKMIEEPGGDLLFIGFHSVDSLLIVTTDANSLNETISFIPINDPIGYQQIFRRADGGLYLWSEMRIIDSLGPRDVTIFAEINAARTQVEQRKEFNFKFKNALQRPDGSWLITGHEINNIALAGKFNILLKYLDINANEIWTRQYGSDSTDLAVMAANSPDGGYIVAGSVYYSNLRTINSTYYIAKDTLTDLALSVTQYVDDLNIIAYPNPAKELLNIQFDGGAIQRQQLHLTNIVGQIMREEQLNEGITLHQLSLKELQSGVYILSLSSEQGLITKRIVIQ